MASPKQTGQRLRGTAQRRCQVQAVGWIVHTWRFASEAPAIRLTGVPLHWCIAEDGPIRRALPSACRRSMHRARAFFGEGHLRPATGVALCEGTALDLAAPRPTTRAPTSGLDAETSGPAALVQRGHQLRSGTAPLGQENDRAATRQQPCHPLQHLFGGCELTCALPCTPLQP